MEEVRQPATWTAEQIAAHPWLTREDISDADKARMLRDSAGPKKASAKMAAMENSIWQPGCVSRMFANDARGELDPVFTMQAWINLDRARSPLIYGKVPNTWAEAMAAFRAFGLSLEDFECEPEEIGTVVGEVVLKMHAAIQAGFGMAIEMQPPQQKGVEYEPPQKNQFGSYLSLYACLVVKCGVAPEGVDYLEVGRARALVAAMRGNEGWRVVGLPYALRGVTEEELAEFSVEQSDARRAQAQQRRQERAAQPPTPPATSEPTPTPPQPAPEESAANEDPS
jgi:hypothetical protein